MKGIAFGLFGLILTLPRVALMCIALVIIHVTCALEGLQEWVDARSGVPMIDPKDGDE